MKKPHRRSPRVVPSTELARIAGGSESRNIEFEMIKNEIQKLSMIDHVKDQQEKIE